MPNNIAVSITADVADLSVKRAIASSELKALTADLNGLAKTARTSGMTTELRASMLSVADGAGKAKAEVRALDVEMKKLAADENDGFLAKTVGGLKTAAIDGLTEKLGVLGAGMEALGPIAAVAGAAFAGLDFAVEKAKAAAEWAEGLKRAAGTLGLTTTQLQEFDFVFNAMGIDVERGRETLSGLAKTIGIVESGLARSMSVKAFTDGLKISPDDLRGWGTLEQQLPHILDALAKLDPEERAAISQRLKVDPQVISSMIAERDSVAGLIDELHKYGIVISADVVDKTAEGAGKMRAMKAVVDGELRVAFIDLAPAIVMVAQNVAHASEAFADLVQGVKHVTQPFVDFVNGVGAAVGGVHQLTSAIGGLVDSYLNPLHEVVDLLQQIGHQETAKADKANTKKDVTPPTAPKPVELSTPKTPKAKDDIVAKWREQLHEQEIASNDFFADNTAAELAFWQGKLALTRKNSKDWLAVQSEIFTAAKTLAHQAYDEQMAALEAQAAADQGHWTKYRADLQAELDLVRKTQGAESAAYQQKFREIEAAEREHADKMAEAQEREASRAIKALKDRLDTQTSIMETQANSAKAANDNKAKSSPLGAFGEVGAAKADMAIDQQVAQAKLAAEQQVQAAILAADQADIARKAALYGQDSENYRAAVQKKEDDEQAFASKVQQLNAQMVAQQQADTLKIQQAWNQAITPIVDSFGSGIQGMIEGTENLRTAMRGVATTILGVVIQAIEKWVAAQIVALIMGQSAGAASAKTQVAAAAGVAGANGVASMALAPFPIDLTAPAFGAAMEATALAFGAFDKGMDVVPNDMLALVHAGERIVPAADNAAIMSAVANDNGSRGGGEQHDHYHYSPTVQAGVGQDVMSQLKAHESDFVRMMRDLHRKRKFA